MNPEAISAMINRKLRSLSESSTLGSLEVDLCEEANDRSESFRLIIRDRLWGLLCGGILAPGQTPGDAHTLFPWVRLTEYGKQVLHGFELNPYDGFQEYHRCLLTKLQAEIKLTHAAVDDVVTRYLYESLRAFEHRLWNSAAVMLGVATEQCLHLLAQCVTEVMDDAALKKEFDRARSTTSIFRKTLNRVLQKLALPEELEKNRVLYLERLFDHIMWSRNDAGHPKPVNIDRYEVFVHLQSFQTYFVWIYSVIASISPQNSILNPGLYGKQPTQDS